MNGRPAYGSSFDEGFIYTNTCFSYGYACQYNILRVPQSFVLVSEKSDLDPK